MKENVSMPLCDIRELQAQVAELKDLLRHCRNVLKGTSPMFYLSLIKQIDNKLKETSDAEDSDSN